MTFFSKTPIINAYKEVLSADSVSFFVFMAREVLTGEFPWFMAGKSSQHKLPFSVQPCRRPQTEVLPILILTGGIFMTPMSNAEYLTRLQNSEELARLKEAKRVSGLSYEQLAEKIGVNKVWLASVFEGQQYVPEEYCEKLADALKLSPSETAFLNAHPYKGNTDPILYRLHEVIDTYGPAIKDIIHEQGGNAIMSAIDFGLDVDVTEDSDGNHRVIIKFDGKLLPYAKKGKYPW